MAPPPIYREFRDCSRNSVNPTGQGHAIYNVSGAPMYPGINVSGASMYPAHQCIRRTNVFDYYSQSMVNLEILRCKSCKKMFILPINFY